MVSTGMDDRLQAGIPPRYVASHPSQLSLLLSVGREISRAKLRRCSATGE